MLDTWIYVTNAGCPARVPWFNFKCPYGSPQPSVTPLPGDLPPTFWLLLTPGMHMMHRH